MDKLYAPWRDRYVYQIIKGDKAGICVFCEIFDSNKQLEERFVLWKNADIAIILNIYPYSGGHVLVIPKLHIAQFDQVPEKILNELMNASAKSMKIIQDALGCHGVNFGANVGRAAGAGIPDHVHLHIVPRFDGDTGFFTTIGNTKQISVDLEKIYKQLKPFFDKTFHG